MPRRRNRLNWAWNEDRQEFTTPSGRVVSLREIAAMMQDKLTNTHDFAGPWTGWRMRQNRLIPPSSNFRASQITPATLRAFNRWLSSYQGEQARLEFDTPSTDRSHTPAPNHSAIPNIEDRDDTRSCQASPHTRPEAGELTREPRRRAKVIQLADFRRKVR